MNTITDNKMTINNHTEIHLSKWDAFKAFIGKTVYLTTEIEVADETEVLETRQRIYMANLWPFKQQGVMEAPKEDANPTPTTIH